MKNYEITIGYKAVISVSVKASDEKEAKEIAIKKFANKKGKINSGGVSIQDDHYKADGIVDMDATWKMYDK